VELIIHPEKKISLRIEYINLKHQEQDVGHLRAFFKAEFSQHGRSIFAE